MEARDRLKKKKKEGKKNKKCRSKRQQPRYYLGHSRPLKKAARAFCRDGVRGRAGAPGVTTAGVNGRNYLEPAAPPPSTYPPVEVEAPVVGRAMDTVTGRIPRA